MNKEDLLKEMKDSVGTKEPTVFFAKMVDALNLLFNRIDDLEILLEKTRINSIMAINWDSRVAARMIDDEVAFLRTAGKTYGNNAYALDIAELQEEYMSGKHSKDYKSFCNFWENLLGYHPFLDSRES